MDFRYTTEEGINDCITGAVISHSEVVDGWTRIFLMDGRALLFPDCDTFCIIYSQGIVQ